MPPDGRAEGGTGGSGDAAPLVSVILAAHDAENYVERTCRSVLAQTYDHFELIVVDDGSSDRTADIVDGLAALDARVRLIRQTNQGVAAARNHALAVAAGECIAPLDADDLWAPTKLARQVQRLQQWPEAGLVYCWWAWINDRDEVLDRSPRWRIEGPALARLVEVNFTGNASVPLYRRTCVQEIGGYSVSLRDEGCQGCEDWDLAMRVAERYPVAVVPAVLVGYRRRSNSMSAQCETMWRSQSKVIAELGKRQPSVSDAVLQRSNGQFALHLAGVAFWSGRYVQAVRWTLRARPITLVFSVLPHVARILTRRLLGRDRTPVPLSVASGAFDESVGAEPLIPYDRIYSRVWDAREG